MRKNILYLLNLFLLLAVNHALLAQGFVHPGLLQAKEDLLRLQQGIAKRSEPLYSGYVVFKDHTQSQFSYKMQGPMAMVGRNPTVGQSTYDADANAAYQNALMWAVTKDHRYAQKAQEIVDGWSANLKSITGRDAILMAGLGPFKMVNAAELLRYTHSGWSDQRIKQTEQHFKTVIYPVIKDLASFANGNWDSAALKTLMAIAVFCNDRPLFEKVLVYYQSGAGDGSLPNYIINEEGQCQESGRDQGHTQLGIAHLADCSEIAWHQGLDLYSLLNNRLLKGFEYSAKFNLGNEVPYLPAMDRTGKYLHEKISQTDRGKLRAVYEEVYNHYVNRRGLAAPFSQQAAEKIRPELQGLPGADHIGFGTFLYTINKQTNPASAPAAAAAPAGLYSLPLPGGVQLRWVPVRSATYYIISRASQPKGPFRAVDAKCASPEFLDQTVAPKKVYYYNVTAVNAAGRSLPTVPVFAQAGLPAGWASDDVNPGQLAGYACYDGAQFVVEGAGYGPMDNNEQMTFVHRAIGNEQALIVRYVPQLSSQFTGFGISFRAAGASVNLIVSPKSSAQVEAPGWVVQLSGRETNSANFQLLPPSAPLQEPLVTFSRMTGYCWLKLVRQDNTYSGFYSADGKEWVNVGEIEMNVPVKAAGMLVYSGIQHMTTTVKFDQVSLK
jgi:hypothetical protein